MDAESKTIASPSCVSTELEARSGPSSVASLPLSALAAVSSQVCITFLTRVAIVLSRTQVPMTLEDHEQGAAYFPEGLRDAHEQQLDLRKKNTWLLKLGEVSTPEIAEVSTTCCEPVSHVLTQLHVHRSWQLTRSRRSSCAVSCAPTFGSVQMRTVTSSTCPPWRVWPVV